MDIETVTHKALRRFAETGNPRGLDIKVAERLALMLLFLDQAETPEALMTPPNYGAHILTGDRAGTWSLMVTRNW